MFPPATEKARLAWRPNGFSLFGFEFKLRAIDSVARQSLG